MSHVCAEMVPMFNHLEFDELQKINQITIHKRYKKGDMIYSPELTGRLVILTLGVIKVYQLSVSSKEQLLRVLEPGDFFGEESLFSNYPTELWAVALTDIEVCMILKDDILKILNNDPAISIQILKSYSKRLKDLETLTIRYATEPIMKRLVGYLLGLQKTQNNTIIYLPLRMKELAEFLLTSPETISRKMKELQDFNLIKRKNKMIKILDLEQLKNMEF